jgi:hypothetical protein
VNIEHETMDDSGIGVVIAKGETWILGIQIGRHMWAVTW